MTETISSQPQPVEKKRTMDIYNFDETSNFPPEPGEPSFRDGYKWVPEKKRWEVDISQSQTKRFEILLVQNPDIPGIRSALFKERQIDGFVQRLKEKEMTNDSSK